MTNSSDSSSSTSLLTADDWKLIDQFVGEIDKEHRCTVCDRIMLDVSQADNCGCRYCSDCLDDIISKGVCNQCNRRVSNWKIPDNYMRRVIRNKIVKCQASECKWSGRLEEMFASHFRAHKNEDQVFKCVYCGVQLESQTQMEKHLNKESGDCPKQPLECPYKCIGCEKIEIINESIGEAIEIEPGSHAHEPMDMDATHSRSLTRQTMGYHLEKNINYHLQLLMRHTNSVIQDYDAKLKTVSSAQTNERPTSSSNLFVAPASPSRLASYSTDIDQKIQNTSNRIDMLQNNHQQMLNDVMRLLKVIENSKLENRILKENLKEVKQMAQDLHKTLAINQVSILALEERLINLEKISYDGTLLWRINNVSERIQEAKSGRQSSFYSPPFYTSRNGYKMCIRVYLNGDGNGRNTHLSLFFVILRGEYDALLRWPFRQKVTFILIDQSASESKENVYDAFRPDPNSSSFKRPTHDMNIASGLPMFCPLSKLTNLSDHEYVKDNTMFIKAVVDVSDLPSV